MIGPRAGGAPIWGFVTPNTGPSTIIPAAGNATPDRTLNAAIGNAARDTEFDPRFYRQFALNAFEEPFHLEPLRRQPGVPRVYLRTVDNAGTPIPSEQLNAVETALVSVSDAFNGGAGIAGLERGAETRVGQAGWITVTWPSENVGQFCGRAVVGGGLIELNYKYGDGCSCGGLAIGARTVKHEFGHAMGFWHTDDRNDLMYGWNGLECDQNPSARERHHAAIAYARPPGSLE